MGNYCTVADCGRKAENRDLGLCATHNKARRVAERPAAPVKVYTMKRGGPLRPVSTKQAGRKREQGKAYARMEAREPRWCVSCGTTEMLTHSHVLPVGNFEHLRDNDKNILWECQECHMVWEHDKHKAHRLHASWDRKMAIIRELAPMYWEEFQDAYPAIFGERGNNLSKEFALRIPLRYL